MPQSLDRRLLRVVLGLDGELRRPTVLAHCVVAAQLADLVISGHVASVDGRVHAKNDQNAPAPQPTGLLAAIGSRPARPWIEWFWRTGADPDSSLRAAVDGLQRDGIWAAAAERRGLRRSVAFSDTRPDVVAADIEVLQRAETQAYLTARNAITLELLVVAFADTWIPLSPAGADFLAKAHDADVPRRAALRDIIESLLEIRYVAGSPELTRFVTGDGG